MANQVASNPKLIEACKLWDRVTREIWRDQLQRNEPKKLDLTDLRPENQAMYTPNDYSPLACTIDGNKAEVTVGSSANHTVHVSADIGVIKYYDTDKAVNEIMKELFEEETGVKCSVFEGGVECEGLKNSNLKKLFNVLSMPTSMDMRQQFCRIDEGKSREYCINKEKELFKQIKRKIR